MNIAERLTRDMVEAGVTVVLRDGGGDATNPVPVEGWVVSDGKARGVATFGPYGMSVSASGVRAVYKDATDDDVFASKLALPAGQVYRYTLTIGVS